jgi:AmmeMemoRadiSam system protein A
MSTTHSKFTSLGYSQRRALLSVARAAIRHRLVQGNRYPLDPRRYDSALLRHRSSFVTLQLEGKLRGCIGSLAATRPLLEDVAGNAESAAFNDSRFAPLAIEELEALEFHISVLSPPGAPAFHSRQELCRTLRPGIDGVVLEEGGRRATFLPAVWSQLPDPTVFLSHLRTKAGLDPGGWSEHTLVALYTVEEFSSAD